MIKLVVFVLLTFHGEAPEGRLMPYHHEYSRILGYYSSIGACEAARNTISETAIWDQLNDEMYISDVWWLEGLQTACGDHLYNLSKTRRMIMLYQNGQ